MKPRNGHTLVVYVVARISGCQSQKEVSLDDQVDHAREVVAEMYNGQVDFRIIATKGKGERLDQPELAEIEDALRRGEADLMVQEDVGRLVRGADANRLWGLAVDYGTRCIAPNDCCDTADDTWEQDVLNACADHVAYNAHTSKRIKHKKRIPAHDQAPWVGTPHIGTEPSRADLPGLPAPGPHNTCRLRRTQYAPGGPKRKVSSQTRQRRRSVVAGLPEADPVPLAARLQPEDGQQRESKP